MSELTGIIHRISDTQQVSDRFSKREFVLKEEHPQYPQYIQMEVNQDKCSLLDSFFEGQQVKVFYNLRGREWVNPQGESKFFNTVQAWKIEAVGQQAPAAQPQEASTAHQQAIANGQTLGIEPEEQDLPF